MSFQPSLTFGILAAAVVSAICWAAALIVSARIDRRRVRQAIHLADRRIAILAPRKAVAGDPRITARLELFAALARSRDFDRELHLRRKAEADLLLAPPYEAA